MTASWLLLLLPYGGKELECPSPRSPRMRGLVLARSTGVTRRGEALLSALTRRSFQMVVAAAERAVDSEGPAIGSLHSFIDQTIEHGSELVLPLHGGPAPLDPETVALRAEVHDSLEQILRRGREDGTVRPDVTAFEIIVFGALLAQPLPHVPNWKSMARREAVIFFDGLSGTARRPSGLPQDPIDEKASEPITRLTAPTQRPAGKSE